MHVIVELGIKVGWRLELVWRLAALCGANRYERASSSNHSRVLCAVEP
jgi:hypothetical protein